MEQSLPRAATRAKITPTHFFSELPDECRQLITRPGFCDNDFAPQAGRDILNSVRDHCMPGRQRAASLPGLGLSFRRLVNQGQPIRCRLFDLPMFLCYTVFQQAVYPAWHYHQCGQGSRLYWLRRKAGDVQSFQHPSSLHHQLYASILAPDGD